MSEFLDSYMNDPYIFSGLIFLITFVLEDLATALAGAAAIEHTIPFQNVYLALFLGIFLGDLGLYGLGRAARRFEFARRVLTKKQVRLSKNWIGKRLIITIIAARFVPGLRLPTYAAFGFFKMSFKVFFITCFISIALWTGLVLGSIYTFNMAIGEALGPWKWVGIFVMIALFILGPKIYIIKNSAKFNSIDKHLRRTKDQDDGTE